MILIGSIFMKDLTDFNSCVMVALQKNNLVSKKVSMIYKSLKSSEMIYLLRILYISHVKSLGLILLGGDLILPKLFLLWELTCLGS